jgi:hypothetical protein
MKQPHNMSGITRLYGATARRKSGGPNVADFQVKGAAAVGTIRRPRNIKLVPANDNKMSIAYRCGVQAKRIGIKLSENPFHMLDHPEAWKQWRDGWMSVRYSGED